MAEGGELGADIAPVGGEVGGGGFLTTSAAGVGWLGFLLFLFV